LGTGTNSSVPPNIVAANNIASWLLKVSKVQMDKDHVRTTKKNLRKTEKILITDPDLSREFSMEEHVCALQSVLMGKAAGFDGIYPKFLKNSGRRSK
jgi:uncharacterized protein (DUF1697 family)